MLAFVSIGFAGFASYGPLIFVDRAIVTMWLTPVPPTSTISPSYDDWVLLYNSKLTFGSEKVIISILQIDVRPLRRLEFVVRSQP